MNSNSRIKKYDRSSLQNLNESLLAQYLKKSELELLLNHCEIVSFARDEEIVVQGTEAPCIYFILSGEVGISSRIFGEGSTPVNKVGEGYFLGESSFIENVPCATSAVALCDVKCLEISHNLISLLSAYYPEIKFKLIQAIVKQVCQRIKTTHDKVTEFISQSDMISLSFFGRVIHSLTQPVQSLQLISEIKEEHLYKKGPFKVFSDAEINELVEHMELLEAAKNCILIHENEKKGACFIVIHGAVQSSIMHQKKIAKLSVIGPGALFASVACIDDQSNYTVTFITCEPALILKISAEKMLYFAEHKPGIWYKLYTLICESLVTLGRSINKLDVRLHIETYNR